MRQWLKELRESSGQTQPQIADKIGITRQYYQQIEAGDRQQKMDITLSVKLSELFGISISEIAAKEIELGNLANKEDAWTNYKFTSMRTPQSVL